VRKINRLMPIRIPSACGVRLPQLMAFFTIIANLISVGCSSVPNAPLASRYAKAESPPRVIDGKRNQKLRRGVDYVVRRGDTLYSIAWHHQIDFADLIRWNALQNPDLIFEGQRIKLQQQKRSSSRKKNRLEPRKSPKNNLKKSANLSNTGSLKWQWPAKGLVEVVKGANGQRGIEVYGSLGQPVLTASAGTVVYSGSGLRGYGELIIIKHGEEFLSAYAHNDKRLVEEGAIVSEGEQIARMGSSGARDVKVRFEIRRKGKPVDPLRYLPKRKDT